MTIVETSSNQFYFIAEYADANLAHVWRGLRVKYTGRGIWKVVGKREEMVRKAGCKTVLIEIPALVVSPPEQHDAHVLERRAYRRAVQNIWVLSQLRTAVTMRLCKPMVDKSAG